MKITILDSRTTHKGSNCPGDRFVFHGSTIQCVDCGLPIVQTITDVLEGHRNCIHCEGGMVYMYEGDKALEGSGEECHFCGGSGISLA